MLDNLYSVMARPIANEPDKKNLYQVDRTPRDAAAKEIKDDEPKDGGKQQRSSSQQHEQEQEQENIEQQLTPKQQGKGKYIDQDGKEHLDFYA